MISDRITPKILLDTDPGGDDTFAFLWLLSFVKRGLASLIAVTSVNGNVSAQKTFSNASQILHLCGFDHIEVGKSVSVKQLAKEDASHIHGSDGMGNLSATLPPAARDFETARYSDEIIIEALNASPGEVTLIAIGPLTNLAAAEEKSPGILQKAKEIVVMAGAFHCRGNVTPHAEFNIWFNPEAAQIVFASRDDIVVMPLDITHHLVLTREMAQTIAQANPEHNIAKFLVSLVDFMSRTASSYRETNGIDGFLVHDAATLGYLFYPETLLLRRANVRVETNGTWTRGQTLIDDRHVPTPRANAWIALKVDPTGFFASLKEDLRDFIAQ